jgi:tetratricopeptide (TPR) repeat protein
MLNRAKKTEFQGWAKASLFMSLLLTGAASDAAKNADVSELLDAWQLEKAFALAQKNLANPSLDARDIADAGRVQFYRGEHRVALRLLDAAREQGVNTGYIHERLRAIVGYEARFQKRDSEHFSIRFLDKDEIVAHYAVAVLEAAYQGVSEALEFYPAEDGEKIVVEIYPDARGLASATGLKVSEIAASGTIAVCKYHRLMITSPLATANGYAWADTLSHELVHLIISKKSHNRVPIWLHEGIAKYYESAWRGPLGDALGAYGEKLLAQGVQENELIAYDAMHPSMAKLPTQEAAALAFAEVFTTIEFFHKRYGKDAVPKLLDSLRQGLTLNRALEAQFGLTMRGVEKAWKAYLRKRKYSVVPGAKAHKIFLVSEEKESSEENPLEEMDDKAAHDYSRLGELLQMRGHHKAALKEYEKAYTRIGLRHPTLTSRLAKAYHQTGAIQKAIDVVEASLKLHDEDADNLLLAGRWALQGNFLEKARRYFERLRLINPFNPEIHHALSEMYEKSGQPQKARLEEHFFELSSKPRPNRIYNAPPSLEGEAFATIITPGWTQVRLDGAEAMGTPAWNYPLSAGSHQAEYYDAKGKLARKKFVLISGEKLKLVLD